MIRVLTLAGAVLWIAAASHDASALRMEATLAGAHSHCAFDLFLAIGGDDGFDTADIPLPPSPPHHELALFTRHQRAENGWAAQPFETTRYLRETLDAGASRDRTLTIRLATEEGGMLSMSWTGLSDALLDAYDIRILDVSAETVIDPRMSPFYDVRVRPGERLYELTLLYRPQATATPDPTVTPSPSVTPLPSVTPTPAVTDTPLPSPTATSSPEPTPTPLPEDGWLMLFETAAVWQETDYTGRCDPTGDGQVDAADVLDLYTRWRTEATPTPAGEGGVNQSGSGRTSDDPSQGSGD